MHLIKRITNFTHCKWIPFVFSGYYLLAEASGRYPGEKARVESARLDDQTDHCLRFYYHMYGNQVDSLKVSLSVCLSVLWINYLLIT